MEVGVDAEVVRLALASVLVSKKRTSRADKRCRKRMLRAVERLKVTPLLRGAPDPGAAIRALKHTCLTCGRCDGI